MTNTKLILAITGVVVAVAAFFAIGALTDEDRLGGLVEVRPVNFVNGIRAGLAETQVIDENGAWVGNGVSATGSLSATTSVAAGTTVTAGTGLTVTAGDATLTDGRLIVGTEATQNCSSNAVTINLSTSAKGIAVVDQASAAACAITLSNGTAGEIVIIDAIYGGDTAWTFVAGGQYIGDTFDESTCDDFQATAADGDHLVITGVMIDADTIMPLSCHYLDQ